MPLFIKHRYIIIIFVLAIALRILFFYAAYENAGHKLFPAFATLDGYHEMAENLLSERGFSYARAFPFLPEAERMPLYPLLIAGIVYLFKSYWAMLGIQIVIGSLIPLIGWRVSQLLITNERIAFSAGLALALEPFSIMLSDVVLTETIFTFLFLIAITFLLKYLRTADWQNIALSSAFLGLATLTKPTVQFLPLIITPFIIWQFKNKISPKKIASHLLIFVGLFILMLAPWAYRNYATFGKTFLTIQSTKNLYMYLVPSAIALENGTGFEEARQQFFTAEERQGINTELLYAPGHQAEFRKRAYAELAKHPLGLLKSLAVTIVTFFTHDGYLSVIQQLGYLKNFHPNTPAITTLFNTPMELLKTTKSILIGPGILVMLGRAIWIIIAVLSIVGLFKYFKNEKEKSAVAWLSLITIAYFAATSAIVGLGINARFRAPIDVFILTFAFYEAARLWHFFKRKKLTAQEISYE